MEMRPTSKITDKHHPLPDESVQCAENSTDFLAQYRLPRRFRRFPASNGIELTARCAVVAFVRGNSNSAGRKVRNGNPGRESCVELNADSPYAGRERAVR